MTMQSEKSENDLERQYSVLRDLPRADFVERWVELYGSAPPKTLTKDLLARGIIPTSIN